MKTLQELGEAAAAARRELRLKQKDVAAQAGITPELLCDLNEDKLLNSVRGSSLPFSRS